MKQSLKHVCIMCLCLYLCVVLHVHAVPAERAQRPLEVELQAVVSLPLQTELGSFARTP